MTPIRKKFPARKCLSASRILTSCKKVFGNGQHRHFLCMDNKMPIVVFNMNVPGNIQRVVMGEKVGSTVSPA